MGFRLHWREGDTEREFAFEDGEYRIGRADDCEVPLRDFGASRRHARIVAETGRVTIFDMKSKGGTHVNGESVVERELHDGDVLRLGQMYLCFESDDAPGRPADVLNDRAVASLRIGSSGRAKELLERALSEDPLHAEASFNLAVLPWSRGEAADADARTALTELYQASGRQPEVGFVLAQLHRQRSDLELALPLLDEARRARPDDTELADAVADLRERGVDRAAVGELDCPFPATTVALAENAAIAAIGDVYGNVRVLDLVAKAERHDFCPEGGCTDASWSHEDLVLLAKRGRILKSASAVSSVQLSDDGRWLLAGLEVGEPVTGGLEARGGERPGGAVVLWDLAGDPVTYRFPERIGRVLSASMSRDGTRAVFVTVDPDEAVEPAMDFGASPVLVGGHPDDPLGQPSWGRFAPPAPRHYVHVWDLPDGPVRRLDVGSNDVAEVCSSGDGRVVATSGGYVLSVWDVETGQLLTRRDGCRYVAIDGDGSTLLTEEGGIPYLKRVHEPEVSRSLSPRGVGEYHLSDDGRLAAWRTADGAVLWDVERSRPVRTWRGDLGAIDLGANGARVALAGGDRTVRIWQSAGPDRPEEPRFLRSRRLSEH